MNTRQALDQLMVTLLIAFLISEVAAVVIERPIVAKRNRSNPGGWLYVTVSLFAATIISFIVSWLATQSLADSMLITGVLIQFNVAEMLFLQTWISGPTPEEEHEKFNQLRALTREHFGEDLKEIKRRARERTREKYYNDKARGGAQDQRMGNEKDH